MLLDVSQEECKQACALERSFMCMSVDYYVDRNICYQSAISSHFGYSVTDFTRYVYYERVCK